MKVEDIQVGGNHYKKMAYQTARFGFDVGLESLGTQIAKYLTRDKGSRIENLEKAYHCIALDQSFDEELSKDEGEGEYTLDIYCEIHDDEYLDKYFAQFPDGDKLKKIMIFYMKAEYSSAKRSLRRYINGLGKFEVGDKVRMKSGECFSNDEFVVTVRNPLFDTLRKGDVWLKETRTYICESKLEKV